MARSHLRLDLAVIVYIHEEVLKKTGAAINFLKHFTKIFFFSIFKFCKFKNQKNIFESGEKWPILGSFEKGAKNRELFLKNRHFRGYPPKRPISPGVQLFIWESRMLFFALLVKKKGQISKKKQQVSL